MTCRVEGNRNIPSHFLLNNTCNHRYDEPLMYLSTDGIFLTVLNFTYICKFLCLCLLLVFTFCNIIFPNFYLFYLCLQGV